MFIYRRKTSRELCKYWSVKFTGADGRQVLRSTGQQEKDKAREVALAWDKAARLALNGTLTHAASQALFNELLTATSGENFNVPKVEAYFASWLEAKRTSGKPPALSSVTQQCSRTSLRFCQSDDAPHFSARLPRWKSNGRATQRPSDLSVWPA
jgi:hypothetical protein